MAQRARPELIAIAIAALRWLLLALFCGSCAEIVGADFNDLEPLPGAGGAGGASPEEPGGAAGSAPSVETLAFPSTQVLDDFEDERTLRKNWDTVGASFSVSDGELVCTSCSVGVLWNQQRFDERQEVHARVRAIGSDAWEYNHILRAQDVDCDLIEALYSHQERNVRVAYCIDGVWNNTESVSLTLAAGDHFGARIDASDRVSILVNGSLVETFEIVGFGHRSGRIGVNGIQSKSRNAYDDFGGGNW